VPFEDFYFEIEKLIFSPKFVNNLFLAEKAKLANSLPPLQASNTIVHPLMNGSSNKIVFFPNEQKQSHSLNNQSSNQYYSNIPNIFKKNIHMPENHYLMNYSEYNFPTNNSEMPYNYQNQSIDINGNPNLYNERNSQMVYKKISKKSKKKYKK